MNKETQEILEHLKEYLQSKIDNGEHKIFYNDLMWDIKTIDCINAIDNLQEENKRLEENICKALEFYEQYGANLMKNGVIVKSVKTILKGE